MRRLIVLTAAAAALACSAQAQSQPSTPNSDPPASSAAAAPPSQPAAGASASGTNTAATAQDLSAGLAVKDSTGAAIGQISGVKTDAGGKRVATIKMGSSSFAVDADKLAVENGAARINATQAELQAMIKKPK